MEKKQNSTSNSLSGCQRYAKNGANLNLVYINVRADLPLWFLAYVKSWFSHNAALIPSNF